LLPLLNTATFEVVLKNFATTVAASTAKHVLLVLDNAPWHHGAAPEGIELVYQPPYSPEVQPAEYLWALTDETVKNRCFDSLSTSRLCFRAWQQLLDFST